MKIKKIISIISAFALIFSLACSTSSAADESNIFSNGDITIEFNDEISVDAKNEVIAHFTDAPAAAAEARNVLCDLLGHKLETGTTNTTTHKVNATAPRCLLETFNYEICSRCDYSNYTLVNSRYINCCS